MLFVENDRKSEGKLPAKCAFYGLQKLDTDPITSSCGLKLTQAHLGTIEFKGGKNGTWKFGTEIISTQMKFYLLLVVGTAL